MSSDPIEMDRLRQRNASLAVRNVGLRMENEDLRDEVAFLRSEYARVDDLHVALEKMTVTAYHWESEARRLAGELAQCHAAGD